ncbi:MAG: 50S ribosomal protein L21 [Solirubrobacterales bacterium]|nr:50S ribosomal protein L21 [Solirubrobacterales bacterium]
MYAIVKTGGKQYRVEEGQSLLVERLPVDDGGQATLTPLLFVDGSNVVDGEDLAKVTVEARVVAHERGPKLRVVKFKPKRGYKRRTGHRQELTRIEVTSIKLGSRRASGSGRRAAKPVAADNPETGAAEAKQPEASAPATQKPPESAAEKPKPTRSEAEKPTQSEAEKPKPTRTRRSTAKPKTEEDNGA